MKKLLVWMMLAAMLLTGCGTKKSPSNAETVPPEPSEPVTQESQQTVELLPEDFPLDLHFSSGAGGWQTNLLLQRDGSFTGCFLDTDMGVTGADYPYGTVYRCDFEGRFGSMTRLNDTTLSLTLEKLTALTAEEDVWYEEGVRIIGATPYGLEGGAEFRLYLPEHPVDDLSDSALSGWPLRGESTATLDCWGLHNVAEDQVFYDWTYWFPEGTPGTEKDTAVSEAATEPDTPEMATQQPSMALYDLEGLRIRLPTEHLPKLLVTTLADSCAEELNPHDLTLMTLREKASVEAAETDYGDSDGIGFLFGFSRLDQVGFEALVQHDYPGCSVFARDETYYYAVTYPTDVQFYRSGNFEAYEADLQEWEILNGLRESICQDIMVQNGLTPCDHRDLYRQEFTYKGNHVYVNFYPYFSVDGSLDNFRTLILSQPVTQGIGGIWCVERTVDEFGNLYLVFPQQDVPAAEYYAARQVAHDGGAEAYLLTPLGAAEDFLRQRGWFSDELAEGSLEEMNPMVHGYTETNR